MKNTGIFVFILTFILGTAVQVAFADETISEGVSATSNDAKRNLKKAAHRAEELFCANGDVECGARLAKNRMIEVKDEAVDGAEKIKNKID